MLDREDSQMRKVCEAVLSSGLQNLRHFGGDFTRYNGYGKDRRLYRKGWIIFLTQAWGSLFHIYIYILCNSVFLFAFFGIERIIDEVSGSCPG